MLLFAYRLYVSPLANFSGTKFAISTMRYEFTIKRSEKASTVDYSIVHKNTVRPAVYGLCASVGWKQIIRTNQQDQPTRSARQ